MKGPLLVALVGLAGLVAVGCSGVSAPVVPPMGMIYSSVQAPLDTDFNKTELAPTAKVGRATSTQILGFAFGDASTKAAAHNGGMKVINHADYEAKTLLLGLYATYTTIVYGD